MKLTPNQLKKLIKEEVENLQSNQGSTETDVIRQITDVTVKTLKRMILAPVPLESISWDIRNLQGQEINKNKVINDVTTFVIDGLRGTMFELVSNVVNDVSKS